MPPGPGKRGKTPAASGSEGIDALPNEVLEHILGLLPTTEAVRTCVLARRWRNLWKSATGLRVRCVVGPDDDLVWGQSLATLKARLGIVDQILRLREGAYLDTFEVVFCHRHCGSNMDCLNRWVQNVILCRARTIKILNLQRDVGWDAELPLVSMYLTRLELAGVGLQSSSIDFSGCPSLEHLDFVNCFFFIDRGATNITSESLKHLTIRNCYWGSSALVRVPNLVSLRLDGHFSRPPMFQSMPVLQEAFVRIRMVRLEGDDYYDSYDCEVDCFTCGVEMFHEDRNGIFSCLSEAENLALISGPEQFVFYRDLELCPTFSKLKSLLLDDSWCVVPSWLESECTPPYYFHALACILKHSPVLQKLCIQFFSTGPKHNLVMKGRPNAAELSTGISRNLKIVEVKCEVADKRVFHALKFLGTFGIGFSSDDVDILE